MSFHAKILTRAWFKKPAPYFSLFLFLFFLSSCDPTKKLLPGEYLVDKVEVQNTGKTDLQKENMEAFFRQKPNRKLFRKVHFFVWWYNQFNEQKIQRKKVARNLKYDKKNADKVKKFEKKNARRISKGKKPKVPKLKDKESPIFLESLRDIGEPAVVFDSMLTEQTRLQLGKYLFSKGYFNNMVTDSVKFLKNRRVHVKYILHPGKPYTVDQIVYDMDDENLGALMLADTVNTLFKRGMQYDADKIQTERQRMTDFALNNGYFYFENAYIDFNVDTDYVKHSASMIVNLKKFGRTFNNSSDSVVYEDHPRFRIEHVYVITQPVYGNIRDVRFTDTLKSRSRPGMAFLLMDRSELAYRRSVLRNNIDIWPGHFFRKDTAEQTYKQLLGMGIFRSVTIQFLPTPDRANRLDCYIMCSPLDKQSLTTQVEGTNTFGNLGIDGSVGYQNRNFFRGGELLELKLQGAISAQKQLSKDSNYIKSITDVTDLRRLQRTFNTIQVGPELSFSAPRAYFPFSLLPFRKDQLPRTYIKTALNYQSRPEFSRVSSNIDYGFSFRTSKNRLKHDFIPVEVYMVRAKLLPVFKSDLARLKDAFLLNSFQDHITTLTKYGLTYTSKESSVSGKRAAFFAKLNVESSGSFLRKMYDLTGQPQDSAGRYLVIGIPFAQFLRSDVDFRIYIPVRTRSRVVYRIAGGIGKPLTNLNVLPYEQSFFSGGPNSVRAWRARTLGPGSYDPSGSETRFDKIGDILLEGNFEYRFHIIKSFNGAFFVDAGNIWRLEPDRNKPGGQFVVGKFIDEVAIGGGLGIRWDLNFFVLRLDLAAPLKDPKYAPGDRWTFDKRPWRQTVANFGIGYPF